MKASTLCSLVYCGATLSGAVRPLAGQSPTDRRVLVYDEGHNNFTSTTGPISMSALLDIARSIGLEVRIGKAALNDELSAKPDLLVIAMPGNIPKDSLIARFSQPLGSRGPDWAYWSRDLHRSAYTDAELRALVAWIDSGGRLLLIIDHAPVPAESGALARAIGVDVRDVFTSDVAHYPPGYVERQPRTPARAIPTDASWMQFTRSGGMLGSHPIMDGDSAKRRVNAVATYTGSSIQGPVGSTALLQLSDSAVDYFRPWEDGPEYRLPARGRSQAVAYALGRGRVVVIAEAGVIMKDPFGTSNARDPSRLGVGIDYGRADNRLFAENILRWLSGTVRPGGR